MFIQYCKSKIAHATVTESELWYEGSITVDEDLLKAVDIIPGERVQVLNINNGNRFDTYVIAGNPQSGTICLNGPAARLGLVGDQIMILSYGIMTPEEAKQTKMKTIHLDEKNHIKE
ncbi:Aspartate 1-decarboxylase [hydrothermal vent metagenome]|uniref:Aspartate 1-decarboxylase n=1 Tax=hydrothermal vent metagenome TaxID=652676 RepID=A0A3B1E4R3_9ZZZZ